MTKHEFLYDHDLDSVVDLILQYQKVHYGNSEMEDKPHSSKAQLVDAKEFFL